MDIDLTEYFMRFKHIFRDISVKGLVDPVKFSALFLSNFRDFKSQRDRDLQKRTEINRNPDKMFLT